MPTILAKLCDLRGDLQGNMALLTALLGLVVTLGVGTSVDFTLAYGQQEKMQHSLDAGVLAAVHSTSLADQRAIIKSFILANSGNESFDFDHDLELKQNSDASITVNRAGFAGDPNS